MLSTPNANTQMYSTYSIIRSLYIVSSIYRYLLPFNMLFETHRELITVHRYQLAVYYSLELLVIYIYYYILRNSYLLI